MMDCEPVGVITVGPPLSLQNNPEVSHWLHLLILSQYVKLLADDSERGGGVNQVVI